MESPDKIVTKHISRSGNLRICDDAVALQNDITKFGIDYHNKKKNESEFIPSKVYDKYLVMEPIEFKNWLFSQILTFSKTHPSNEQKEDR